MKKILVFNFSPRKNGNGAALTKAMAEEIAAEDCEVKVYTTADLTVNPCRACGACKKKDVPSCVQKDDFAALIPALDACDGIVFVAPIYFGRVPGTAKNFIDRLYCFYNPAVGPMFTKKETKRLATVMTFGGGPAEVYQKEAEWLGGCFQTIGVNQFNGMLRGNLNSLWSENDPYHKDILADAKALAIWIAE